MEVKDAVAAIETKLAENKTATLAETTEKVTEVKTFVAEEVQKITASNTKNSEDITEIKSIVTELQKKGGRFAGGAEEKPTMYNIIWKGIEEKKDVLADIVPGEKKMLIEFKGDMTVSGSLTGSLAPSVPNVARPFGRYRFHVRDLFPVYNVSTGAVLYPRENTTVVGQFSGTTFELQTKSTIEYKITNISLTLHFLAATLTISREMLQDVAFLQSYLSANLTESFLRQEDTNYLSTLTGLATGGSTGATSTNCAEYILDYIAQVEAAGYTANAILVSPATWADLMKTKGGVEYGLPGAVSIDASGNMLFAGISVIRSPQVAANHVWVMDANQVGIFQSSSFNVRTSEEAGDIFFENGVAFRAEARTGLGVFAPSAVIYGPC